jgi:hypothetical protein
VVDIEIDLDVLARDRKLAYEERTGFNRDATRLKHELVSLPTPGEPRETIEVSELMERLEELTEQDKGRLEAKYKLAQMRTEAKELKSYIGEAEVAHKKALEDLDTLQEEYKQKLEKQRAAVATCEKHVTDVSQNYNAFVNAGKQAAEEAEALVNKDLVEEIEKAQKAITNAEALNREVAADQAAVARRERIAKQLAEARAEVEVMTEKIRKLDEEKDAALAKAKMPIEGLSIDEEKVLYNNYSLAQASGAEQLQISLAIAAALSPELEDVWVKDGSLLDEESLKAMHEFAENRGIRIWLERVGESDEDCIVLEEGTIRV